MSNEWLQNLKPGDAVCVQNKYGLTIDIVHKVTDVHITILGPSQIKFKKSDGRLIGDTSGHGWLWLTEPTERTIEIVRTKEKIRELKQQIINTINTATVDQLERVVAILSEDKPNE